MSAETTACNVSLESALNALELMADQYLQVKDSQGQKRYDHMFMSAGEECLDVLIAAGRIPAWMDYREDRPEPTP